MSVQWTAIAAFLYLEIALTIILLLPIVSPTRWQRIFSSNLFRSIRPHANYIFSVLIFLLVICFVDAVREMRKYDGGKEQLSSLTAHPNAVEHAHMKLFRAQRNFYIAGFALFLWFVLRRLVTLIHAEAKLQSDLDAANSRQDESAPPSAPEAEEDGEEENSTPERLEMVQAELEMLKTQSKLAAEEYDRLTEDYQELQRKYDSEVAHAAGDKKSD